MTQGTGHKAQGARRIKDKGKRIRVKGQNAIFLMKSA
jgi:hypothetical protein